MTSKDLIRKLGGFLADLTGDRPPARIHAELFQRAGDPQIRETYPDVKDFITVWTALRHGHALPEQSWLRLVLPTVAFYSSREALKPNTEMALYLWRSARDAPLEALPPEPTVRLVLPLPAPEPVADPAPVKPKRRPWAFWRRR